MMTVSKAKKKKSFEVTATMFVPAGLPSGGAERIIFGYASQFLRSLGWDEHELRIGIDSPLKQDCTGHEHRGLLMAGGGKRTYCPGAKFKVTTRRGLEAFMCRECVELLATAIYQKDRDRITELWAQMLKELVAPKDGDDAN